MSSIDYDALRAAAEAEVSEELAKVTDPHERRALAEEIRDQAHMELSLLKAERQQLIAAAAWYEYHPHLHEEFGIGRLSLRRLAMAELLGGFEDREDVLNPPRWPEDRVKAARKAGIPQPPADVIAQAAQVAARYEAAEARRDAAVAQLEDTYDAVRTAGGRVTVSALERPDFEAIRQAARTELAEEFDRLDASDEERLRRAADAVDQAEETMAKLLPKRDAAVSSLSAYTTARGVYYSAGVNRNSHTRILARALGLPRDSDPPKRAELPAAARAARVKFIKNADKQLPKIAQEYEAAKARQAAAIEIRNEMIGIMHGAPHEWTRSQIAEAIDRDPKIVARVVAADENS
ncbi:hypothetical protein [Streptomyces sp. NPDC088707]|uniref:hypothetical protein n=1 Tax=Streptomyces sp. NPDC088707 TaxID=3365871 RepID=UPI003805BE43